MLYLGIEFADVSIESGEVTDFLRKQKANRGSVSAFMAFRDPNMAIKIFKTASAYKNNNSCSW